jgi:hypothetical protein
MKTKSEQMINGTKKANYSIKKPRIGIIRLGALKNMQQILILQSSPNRNGFRAGIGKVDDSGRTES